MTLRDRYESSHRYAKRSVLTTEILVLVLAVGAVVACFLHPADDPWARALFCVAYLACPLFAYGYLTTQSQFLTPEFGRIRVERTADTIAVETPSASTAMVLGPLFAFVTSGFLIALTTPFSDGTRFHGPLLVTGGVGIVLIGLLLGGRSAYTISRGTVSGTVRIGFVLTVHFRSRPVEKINIGVSHGVSGPCDTERILLGRTYRASRAYRPQITLAVLNNAYFQLTPEDVAAVAAVPVTVDQPMSPDEYEAINWGTPPK